MCCVPGGRHIPVWSASRLLPSDTRHGSRDHTSPWTCFGLAVLLPCVLQTLCHVGSDLIQFYLDFFFFLPGFSGLIWYVILTIALCLHSLLVCSLNQMPVVLCSDLGLAWTELGVAVFDYWHDFY